uniref:hypothetical protein n=1 Tax=Paraconexibacter sp. TaxID=2949640 RepID=UPI0035650364
MEDVLAAALVTQAERLGADPGALAAFAERYLRRRPGAHAEEPEMVAAEVAGAFALADERGDAPSVVRAH